jgi:hypothetical protein
MRGTGHPASAVYPELIEVNTGMSLVGVQFEAVASAVAGTFANGAGGVNTSASVTICLLESLKASATDPVYTPMESAVLAGVTVIVAGCDEVTVPDFGLTLNKDSVETAVAVNEIAFDDTFEIAKVCGGGELLTSPEKSSPPGDTCNGTAVPAGTMFNTTVIDTGGCMPSVGVRVTEP